MAKVARRHIRKMMLVGLLGLLCVPSLGFCVRAAHAAEPDRDPWFGRDKALHFSFSAGLATSAYAVSAIATDDRRWRVFNGTTFALLCGVAKETSDALGAGDPSWRDLTWDVVGTATGVLVSYGADRLITWLRSPAN